MGLDLVELAIDVEETFGVKIPDAEAAEIRTVGQLWEFLSGHVVFDLAASCPSAAAFYRLRQGVVAATGIDRSTLRPTTRLDSLIPKRSRRRSWKVIGAHASLKLPDLELGNLLRAVQLYGSMALAVFVVLCCVNQFNLISVGILGLAAFVVAVVAMDWFLTPWKYMLQPACSTLGEISTYALGLNEEYWKGDSRRSREAMWEKLRALIATRLGVPYDEVTYSARFVEDFGAD